MIAHNEKVCSVKKMRIITLRINETLAFIGGLALFIMMLQTTGDVVGRYFFSSPIKGTIEITEMLMLILVYFGLAYAESQDKHIAATVLVSHLSRKLRFVALLFDWILGIFICSLLSWHLFGYAFDMFKIKKVLEGFEIIPFYPVVFVTAFGFFLMVVEYLLEVMELITSGGNQ